MDSSADIQEGGAYTLTVIGENDCESTLDFEIFEDFDEPEVELENEDINCDNQKADILISIDDPGATFSWEGPSFNSDLQNVVVENEGEYFVTITGSNGCTTIESVDIQEDLEMPNIVVVDDTLSCLDEPILLTATSTTDDVIIQWLGPNGFDSTGVSVLTDMEGEYFVTAIGPNGCSTQVELEVFNTPVYPDVSLNFLNNISCQDSTTAVSAEVSGDIQSVLWSNNDSFSTDEESFITELGGTFVFTATGNNGCITVDSVEILIDTLYPNVVVNQIGRILCDINTVNITGEGSDVGPGISYEWKTDDGIISFGENTLNPLIQGEGTYLLAIKNESNGCINTETLVVEREESTLESMDLDFKIQTCNDIEDGEIFVAGVSGGIAPFRYALEGTSFTENSLFEGLNAGDYIVSVKDSFGCVVDSLVVLQEKNQIDVSLGDDVDVLLGEEVSVTADINIPLIDVASILWEPASVIDCNFCTDFNFVPGKNMVVSVFVIDEDGCTDEDQMIIRVDDEIKLYVPNIFTPNDDGINDNFTIPISPNVAMVNSFRIYDRWGSRVFQDENFVPGSGESWNGRHLNRSVVGGVYLYVAEVEMINGDIRIIRGDITVMK
jgi:gliding motility-associated-like protein